MLNESNDRSLLQKVIHRLSRTVSGGKTRVVAFVRRDVTLTGTLQYEMQRRNFTRVRVSVASIQ